MKKYRNYTDDDVIRIAKEVFSLADLLRKLGLVVAGGNYDLMRSRLQKLSIDTSHWTGSGWSKGHRVKNWTDYTGRKANKKALIELRTHKCESCGLDTWLNNPIALEVHHIDGDRTNNILDNLQLLCPNCHSTTDSWRGRNIKLKSDNDSILNDYVYVEPEKQVIAKELKVKKELEYTPRFCTTCNGELSRNSRAKAFCSTTCRATAARTNNRPSKEILSEQIWKHSAVSLGQHYNVSDVTIRKWCVHYDIDRPKTGHWANHTQSSF